MPTACINHTGARIHLKSERLEVVARSADGTAEEVLREIPIRDLDRVILAETVQITSSALAALLRSGISVSLLGWNGGFIGGFLPAQSRHGLARLRQYQRTSDNAFAREMAGRIVTAKIYNQRRILQRLLHRGTRTEEPGAEAEAQPRLGPEGAGKVKAALAWMDGLLPAFSRASSIEEIRGYEGASTGRYFQTWACFLPEAFPFERRSTRPPLNPVNACISFAATLLCNEMASTIHAHGLDPALGLLHATEDGRWSLALDLMEPFRPVVAEALALDLFSHEMLKDGHFERRDGGVFLNEEGRRRFLLQYERRMERQFMSECAGHRTTLRQQVEAQAVMFKRALEAPEKFEPFLMN